jgi:hypothetical protein
MRPPRPWCLLAAAFLVSAAAVSPLLAADDPRACCTIIRVEAGERTAWLRNPRGGMVAQFRWKEDDATAFKLGDRFNPDERTLNGAKLERAYAMVTPQADPPNAKVVRVRGHEIAAAMDESKTVYRIYALKFGLVLSSIRPGDPIYIDEPGDWAYFRVEQGNSKPSVFAFKLD